VSKDKVALFGPLINKKAERIPLDDVNPRGNIMYTPNKFDLANELKVWKNKYKVLESKYEKSDGVIV
jgi:hypothetical protein